MGEFVLELWAFMKERKKFWLLPIVVVLALFGTLIVLTQGSAVAPVHLHPVLSERASIPSVSAFLCQIVTSSRVLNVAMAALAFLGSKIRRRPMRHSRREPSRRGSRTAREPAAESSRSAPRRSPGLRG